MARRLVGGRAVFGGGVESGFSGGLTFALPCLVWFVLRW